ncbi:MAG: TadE family protein [Terracidiphilus sp.]
MFRLRDLLHAPYQMREARLGESAVHNKQGALCEQGASLVEMALSASVLFVLLFGIIETCMALYAYNFVSEAAREATRYAVVRGPNSCLISSTFPACNLNPLTYGNGNTSYTPSTSTTPSTSDPIQSYVNSLGLPYASQVTAVTSWYVPNVSGGVSSWPTANQCSGADESAINGTTNPCNNIGNAVQVTVYYNFPLAIPYWKNATLNIHSTSQMIISE